MTDAPSSTWFTAAPHWGSLIALYFFVGGLAGGSYFLAALMDLFGSTADRRLARIGYYVAFPCIAFGALLLTVDLTRPMRFWHMMIESNTLRPMFKPWSPMSIGVWAMMLFGLVSILSFLAVLAEDDRIPWQRLRDLRPPSAPGQVLAWIGGASGLYVAGYTGVLLAVTNRPIWSDTPLLGMLFVISGTSTGAALIMLVANRSGLPAPALVRLHRMDEWMIVLELVVLAAVVISLGDAAVAWKSIWGVLLAVVVFFGNVMPLVFSLRSGRSEELNVARSATLVLLGGLLLRIVIVFSSESI